LIRSVPGKKARSPEDHHETPGAYNISIARNMMSASELEGTLGLDAGLHKAARQEIALSLTCSYSISGSCSVTSYSMWKEY